MPLLAAGAAGCDDSALAPAKAPAAGAAPWTGEEQRLFDDAIDTSALGVSLDGASPATDPLLRLRTAQADLVARMRVSTVTRDANGQHSRYVLTMEVGRPTLAPAKIGDAAIDLSIPEQSGAFQLVANNESGLRHRTFIGFVRRFAGSEEGPALHWHLTADTAEVAKAVEIAAALDNFAN